MSLNIKNQRVHALAREAARVTGQTQTGVIEEALELLLAERRGRGPAEDRARRLDLLRQVSLSWSPKPGRGPQEVEDLYDPKTGLPR